jgi:hypothetical protein
MHFWYGFFTAIGLVVVVIILLVIAYVKWALSHWGF